MAIAMDSENAYKPVLDAIICNILLDNLPDRVKIE